MNLLVIGLNYTKTEALVTPSENFYLLLIGPRQHWIGHIKISHQYDPMKYIIFCKNND